MGVYFPAISIIVPSLNQGQFLKQALDSIFDQGYPNLEVVVMDGGSSDNSVDVIRTFANKLIYWQSQSDGGQTAAINAAVKYCNGDLIAWLNADDFYLPYALERVAEAYSNDNNAPFYFGDGLRVDQTGRTIKKFFPTERLRFDRSALLLGLNYILQPSTFINHTYIRDRELLDIGLEFGMDYDLWIRLSTFGNPQPINSVLSASREYAATKTSTGSFGRVEELRGIIMKHSGTAITPGTICYFLDTLHRFVEQDESLFPKAYSTEVLKFWQKTSELFDDFDARPDGFPKSLPKPYKVSRENNQDSQEDKLIAKILKRFIGLQ